VLVAGLFAAGCNMLPLEDLRPGDGETAASPEAAAESAAPESAPDPGRPRAAPESTAELPAVELDGDLIYKVLLGEIAAKRGAGDTASESLIDAARASRDPRLAQRAVNVALNAERFDLAEDAATLWVELSPGNDRPLESLGLIMVEQGHIDAAVSRFVQILEKAPDRRVSALRRMARYLGQLSNRENALAAMEGIVARYQDDADAHFAEAFLAARVERGELVLKALDRALELRPDWEEAALAKIGHLIQNQYPRKQIDAFAGGYLESDPDATRVRMSYARYLVDQQAGEQALKQFETVLEYAPRSTAGLLAAGLLSMDQERYRQARRYLMKHLALTPDNDQIRLYLGQVAEQREQYDEAAEWYKEVSDQDHRFTAALRLAGVIRETDGVDAALDHLSQVRPDDEPQFVRLALTKEMVLREADDLPRAKGVLDDAVARYPDNSDLLYARGLLAAQLNRISEHERDMRALLDENPNNAHALNALGYTLADATDRIDEAFELIKKALSMRPDDPFILDSMGWVHYRMGNYDKAIEYLEKALSKRNDAEIAAHLGEVLWVTGNTERAREIWNRAKEEQPDNDVLVETIQRFLQ